MAPTEVLAEQHYQGISRLLADSGMAARPGGAVSLFDLDADQDMDADQSDGSGLVVALLTGNRAEINLRRRGATKREELLEWVADARIDILIGTHALIQGRGTVPASRGGRGRRAAPFRRPSEGEAQGQGRGGRPGSADHDRHSHPQNPLHDVVRGPRRVGDRRDAPRTQTGQDEVRFDGRSGPRESPGDDPAGGGERATGIRGLPAGRRIHAGGGCVGGSGVREARRRVPGPEPGPAARTDGGVPQGGGDGVFPEGRDRRAGGDHP